MPPSSRLSATLRSLLFSPLFLSLSHRNGVSVVSANRRLSLADLPYASPSFPRRRTDQAAVVEWGNSAVISALDAVSSGPLLGASTSDGAYFEVESAVVIGRPNDGSGPLANAEDVEGNLLVLTNGGGATATEMATMAQDAGAAALMIVNVGEGGQDAVDPPEVGKEEEERAAAVDIPVVAVSLASGNVLTSASEPEEGRDGLPERIRLYASGDRPFFEDVSTEGPTAYLIHNMLTEEECDALIADAEKAGPAPFDGKENLLEETPAAKPNSFKNVDRAFLWKGLLRTPLYRAVHERIEQVTGFRREQISDVLAERLRPLGHRLPRYDVPPPGGRQPLAVMIIFLSAPADGGELVFPSADPPLKIRPARGLAVVVHLVDEEGRGPDARSIRADLAAAAGEVRWTATLMFHEGPVTLARRTVLPALATAAGGGLPKVVYRWHLLAIDTFGAEKGDRFFDIGLLMVPVVLLAALGTVVQKVWAGKAKEEEAKVAVMRNAAKQTQQQEEGAKAKSKTKKKKKKSNKDD